MERSADADEGGGPMLLNAVLGKLCFAEWCAEVGADQHEVGPSSATSVLSDQYAAYLHTAACSRGFVNSTTTSLQ